ncbi:hypothetical protein MLD38_031301 [Melastoma candidum]|uniref:Uncharacterized protein n=1 Tax=Melastoma candidum TaxID=119954 RepID=A0ACB9MPA5_9MYRT|nr:hypothetical protein MLD38_031301 [Melastoma candidum]
MDKQTSEGSGRRIMRMTCQNCGGHGHNKITCKVTPAQRTTMAEDTSVDRSQESIVSPQARQKEAVRRGRGNAMRKSRGNARQRARNT